MNFFCDDLLKLIFFSFSQSYPLLSLDRRTRELMKDEEFIWDIDDNKSFDHFLLCPFVNDFSRFEIRLGKKNTTIFADFFNFHCHIVFYFPSFNTEVLKRVKYFHLTDYSTENGNLMGFQYAKEVILEKCEVEFMPPDRMDKLTIIGGFIYLDDFCSYMEVKEVFIDGIADSKDPYSLDLFRDCDFVHFKDCSLFDDHDDKSMFKFTNCIF